MVAALDNLQSHREGGVVEGRRDLADATADRWNHEPVDDRQPFQKAALRRAWANRIVEGERLARHHEPVVENLGH